jgi:MoaA/NifB/PqqE/SkfB family radical SAM enzyme
MDYGPYSPFKAAHVSHSDRMRALAAGKLPEPAEVQLVPTNRCNHNCLFCAYRSSRSYVSQLFDCHDEIDPHRLTGLVHEFKKAGVSAILFAGGGEPTIHPAFRDALETALDLGLSVGLLTNGSTLHALPIEDLARMAWMRVSVDSATEGTHARIHGTPETEFGRMLESVKRVARIKGRRPEVGMGFVVCPENWMEAGDFVRLGAEIGVDNVRLSPMFFDDAVEAHMSYFGQVSVLIAAAEQDVRGKIRVFNQFGRLLDSLSLRRPEFDTCDYSRLVTYVGADLNVYTCCDLSYNEAGLVGSIRNIQFGEFWKGRAAEFYLSHTTARCHSCKMNDKNGFIRYLLSPESEHVAFI